MRFKTACAGLVLACFVFGMCAPALAQSGNSKADLFLGYSYFKEDVSGYGPSAPEGGGTTLTLSPWRHVGISFDYSAQQARNVKFRTQSFMVGPRMSWEKGHFSPFAEAMVGGAHFSTIYVSTTGFAAGFGGGLDAKLNQYFGVRLFRLDAIAQHQTYGSDLGIRFETGIMIYMGPRSETAKAMPQAACSVSPSEVMAGEPVTANANASGFNPKRTLSYAWTTTGGKTSGAASTTQIDTNGLTPGSYKVSSHVSDGKKATADCSQSFTIKEPPKHPPTISCSADRSTVMQGQSAAISCTGNSEDRRPLTYAWQSSSGNIAGNGQNGTLGTNGVTGPVTVTTTVTDDRGLSANTTTNVTVQAPPPPPLPPPVAEPGSVGAIREDLATKGKALLNVHFDTAKATIRPESEPLLTNAAQVLKDDPSLYIYVDGYTDSRGSKALNMGLSRRRAAAVDMWLVKHGVEAKRMTARGFGPDNPVGDNNTEAGRQSNRRVELVKMSDADKAKAAAAKPAARKPAAKKAAATTTAKKPAK